MPVCVTVLYPGDAKFDLKYYLDHHMPLVGRLFGKHGLQTWRITELSTLDRSKKPEFSIQADLIFNDRASIETAFKEEGGEVLGDIPNFCDKNATLLVGDIKGEGKGE